MMARVGYSMADALADLLADPPPPVSAAEVAELRAWMDAELTELAAGLPLDLDVLRIPKRRLADALGCPVRLAAQLAQPSMPGTAILLGRLIDLAVHHHVISGPAPDLWTVATQALAADDADSCEQLAGLDDGEVAELREQFDERAAGLTGWGEVDPRWWPRCESQVSISFAARRIVAAGRFDLEVGGGGSGRPHAVVEVKSGRSWVGHRDDAFWYALLASLRDKVAPSAVITWTAADDQVLAEPVRAVTLETAARRALDATATLVELAGGQTGEPLPGSGCSTCPVLSGCAAGQAHQHERDTQW